MKNNNDFLRTKHENLLGFSLASAQLSIAGGILALISGVDTYKIIALIAPITTVIGLWLFYYLYKKIKGDITSPLEIDKKIYRDKKKPTISFNVIFLFSTALLYVIILGWELYVGSQAIAFIFGKSNFDNLLAIASFLTILILFYTLVKGYDWVIKSDIWQFGGVVLFLITAFVYHYDQFSLVNFNKVNFFPQKSLYELLLIIISITVINFITQLQNPINWQIVQSVKKINFKKTILFSSIILFLIWILIITFAFLYPANSVGWKRILVLWNENKFIATIMSLGIFGFLASTADSIVFGILNNLRLVKLSWKNKTPQYIIPDKKKLRIFIPIIFFFSMTIAFLLIEKKPEIFFSLLSISGIMTIFYGTLFYIMIGKQHLISTHKYMPVSLFFIFLIITFLLLVKVMSGLLPVLIGLILGFLLPLKRLWKQ